MYTHFFDLDPDEKQGQTLPLIYVWPVPYQGTVSFGYGTKDGPEAILKASYQIETYDARLDVDIEDLCHFITLPFQRTNVAGPEYLYQDMENFLSRFDPKKDFLLTLGGEHSISFPLFKFYARAFQDLVILQIDAHADLRQEYEGSRFSHACIMARARDLGLRIVQIGIRSLCQEEAEYIKEHNGHDLLTFFAWELPDPLHTARLCREFIGHSPVYISFDVDGLDPAIMPGTGTPEPGGIDYNWLNEFWFKFWPGPKLVGMDICELAPQPYNVVSESVAVKCIFNILTNYLKKQQE